MISVKKDFENIPYPLSKENCENGTQERTATTNEDRRKTVIENEQYDDNFNDRYKHKEIRKELGRIYKEKCAFCEQNQEIMEVEHYRPKSIYYWLAFSWDNLLLACATCNRSKSTHFPIENTAISKPKVDYSDIDLSKINHLCKEYDKLEKPLLLNPEQEKDLHFRFSFDRNGEICPTNSNDKQAKKTIDVIKLNRDSLKIARKKIIDDFEKSVIGKKVKDKGELRRHVMHEMEMLKQKANFKTSDENFLAFRNYVVNEGIMKQIIKSVFGQSNQK
ncbi:retron system putative HNH endonuclease [Bernardetia sp. OM2101]|uniref:retron system putative HNH endonuclease n=1 Tax=Bernardetia sp. OM2101 TaxID=3344876 RepID=UPI0035D04D43